MANVFTCDGVSGTLPQLCAIFRIPYGTAAKRLKRGLSIEKALDPEKESRLAEDLRGKQFGVLLVVAHQSGAHRSWECVCVCGNRRWMNRQSIMNYGHPRCSCGVANRVRPEAPDGTKRCCGCNLVKPVDAFNRNRAAKDGMQSDCRECKRAAYVRDRQKVSERGRVYRRLNAAAIHERNVARYWRDPESARAVSRLYQQSNREQCIERKREYYRMHSEEIRARAKTYAVKNRAKVAIQHQRYYRENKAKWTTLRQRFRDGINFRKRQDTAHLRDPYLRQLLQQQLGAPAHTIDLISIQIKREQLRLRRLGRRIKEVAKDQLKETT